MREIPCPKRLVCSDFCVGETGTALLSISFRKRTLKIRQHLMTGLEVFKTFEFLEIMKLGN